MTDQIFGYSFFKFLMISFNSLDPLEFISEYGVK